MMGVNAPEHADADERGAQLSGRSRGPSLVRWRGPCTPPTDPPTCSRGPCRTRGEARARTVGVMTGRRQGLPDGLGGGMPLGPEGMSGLPGACPSGGHRLGVRGKDLFSRDRGARRRWAWPRWRRTWAQNRADQGSEASDMVPGAADMVPGAPDSRPLLPCRGRSSTLMRARVWALELGATRAWLGPSSGERRASCSTCLRAASTIPRPWSRTLFENPAWSFSADDPSSSGASPPPPRHRRASCPPSPRPRAPGASGSPPPS
jgi:hypothetical protein